MYPFIITQTVAYRRKIWRKKEKIKKPQKIILNSGKFTNQTPFNCHYYRFRYMGALVKKCVSVCYRVRITVPSIQVLELKIFHPVPKLSHLSEFESSGKSRSHSYANHHKNPTSTRYPTDDLHPNLSKIYIFISHSHLKGQRINCCLRKACNLPLLLSSLLH